MATNAKYKVYDSTQQAWVEYHFTTNAGQITTTTTANGVSGRKFVTDYITINSNSAGTSGARVVTGSDNNANIEIDGAHITGQASAVSGSSLQYVSASDTIAVALGKLDKAAKDAYDRSPDVSGLVPYTNAQHDVNLGNHDLTVRAIGFNAYDGSTPIPCGGFGVSSTGDLTLEGAANIFLAPTTKLYYGFSTGTNDANEIVKKSDLSNYVPTSRTINNIPLSSNVILDSSNIYIAGSQTSLGAAISGLSNQVNGMATSYAISDASASGYENSSFNSTSDPLDITVATATGGKLIGLNGQDILLSNLKIGDSIFIAEGNVPDRWLADIGTSGSNTVYTFLKLETYDMTWGAITDKPTTIAGYGITDAKIENGTITLGSNSITPITSHQSLANYVTLNTSQEITGDKRLTGTVKVGEGGFYIENDDNNYLTEIAQATSGTHEVTANRTITLPNKSGVFALLDDIPTVNVQNTTPSSAKAGDIWIQTA